MGGGVIIIIAIIMIMVIILIMIMIWFSHSSAPSPWPVGVPSHDPQQPFVKDVHFVPLVSHSWPTTPSSHRHVALPAGAKSVRCAA